MTKWIPMLVQVTQKLDVNGNSYFRCKSNRLGIKPKTIKSAYSRSDAAKCFIKQSGIFSAITGESYGFEDASSIFILEGLA